MNILRPLFHKMADGRWAIQSLDSIALEAADKQDVDFYAVGDGLFAAQPNYISTILATMGQSIVPVVAMVPGEDVMRCLGTGFFVSCTGILITAAHVITDPIDRRYGDMRPLDDQQWSMGALNLGVMVSTNPLLQPRGYHFRPVEWGGFLGTRAEHPLPIRDVNLKLTSDTAICIVSPMLDGAPYQPLSIIQPGIQGIGLGVGKRATAVGYAGMQDVELSPQENGRREGDFRFKLHVSRGRILERFPDNSVTRDVSTPGACFSASLKLPGGMSGSPIFDDEGVYVHGVVSKGWEDENGLADLGYGSMLANSLAMPIEHLGGRSLLELMALGQDGITQARIAGA